MFFKGCLTGHWLIIYLALIIYPNTTLYILFYISLHVSVSCLYVIIITFKIYDLFNAFHCKEIFTMDISQYACCVYICPHVLV